MASRRRTGATSPRARCSLESQWELQSRIHASLLQTTKAAHGESERLHVVCVRLGLGRYGSFFLLPGFEQGGLWPQSAARKTPRNSVWTRGWAPPQRANVQPNQ